MDESLRHNTEQKKSGTKDYKLQNKVQKQAKLISGAISQNNTFGGYCPGRPHGRLLGTVNI